MLINSEIRIADHAVKTSFGDDIDKHARFQICQDLAKQMMDGDYIQIQVEYESNGDRIYHAAVGVFTEDEVKKIERFVKQKK